MKQLTAKIVSNKKISSIFYRMRIASSYLAENAHPGQFVEVRCSPGYDPLLPRPLGCHRILNNGIEVLYEVVGKGTQLLSEKKAGEALDLLGPLGKGFDIPARQESVILVAGGIGVAPLVALAESLRKKRNKVYVAIGARTRSHVMCEKEFRAAGCAVKVATDDGSKGRRCFATQLLLEYLKQGSIKPSRIYACGPNQMLKAVNQIAKSVQLQCQVSMEERMACGVGVCLGCPVKVREGLIDVTNKMVCKDGPVFNAEDILW